jgi:microcystin-dependent protein
MALAWETGENLTGYTCFQIRVPGDIYMRSAVRGALLLLVDPANWEQLGSVTPDEAAEAMQEMWDEFAESDCMIGAIFPYATNNPPDNCLVCDGSQYDRVDYPLLYDILLPGLLVDADHFVTPDLRQQFIWGNFEPNAPLTTGGEIFVTLTEAEMPSHTHIDSGHTHIDAGHIHVEGTTIPGLGGEIPGVASLGSVGGTGSSSANIQSASANIGSTGGGQGHNNIPPFTLLNYAIVAR